MRIGTVLAVRAGRPDRGDPVAFRARLAGLFAARLEVRVDRAAVLPGLAGFLVDVADLREDLAAFFFAPFAAPFFFAPFVAPRAPVARRAAFFAAERRLPVLPRPAAADFLPVAREAFRLAIS